MERKLYIEAEGGTIAALLRRPAAEGCPLVILMHGFMSNKGLEPLKSIAKALEEVGIASLSMDFDGHGESYGRFRDMTVPKEIEDARRVYEYASKLPWVKGISFLGHSQGAVVAGMLAGTLGKDKVDCLVQLAPAAVLKDDALDGVLMGRKYDPQNPPETLWVLFHKVGKGYFLAAQTLPIYDTSALYEGPVLLVHGREDKIVPLRYSERYDSLYKDSRLIVLDGEGHLMRRCRAQITATSTDFIKQRYGL
ncbi:MAG: alpha/beta fold hydrolase [Bacteroidales bacterium]|nr:alpha/beta fold hydrolase [Bacteroidales bacterium]